VVGNAEQRAAAFAQEQQKFVAAEKAMAESGNDNVTPAQESQAAEAAAKSVVKAEAVAKAEAAALVLAKAEAEGNPQVRAAAFSEAQDAFKSAELTRAVAAADSTSSQVNVPVSAPFAPSVPAPSARSLGPVRRRAAPTSRPRAKAPKSKAARSVAISVVINALEKAGIDPKDADVERIVQDLQEDLE
jgi:hypothetical protein